MLTVGFSDARKNLTEIADRVASEGVEYVVFKRSKPLFRIVPVIDSGAAAQAEFEQVCPSVDIPRSRREVAARYTDREAAATPKSPRTEMPDGGEDLFAYAMSLRAQMPRSEFLESLTPEGLKAELGKRHE